MIDELISKVFGTGSISELLSTYFYAYLGAITSLLYQTVKRNPESTHSPLHFSLNYLWSDNSKRCLRSIILIFICIRFSKEIIGINATLYSSFLIGFSVDKLSEFIKKKEIKL